MTTKTRITKIIVATMPIGCDMYAASVFKVRGDKLIRVYSTQRSDRERGARAAINEYGRSVKTTHFHVDRRDLEVFSHDETAAVKHELEYRKQHELFPGQCNLTLVEVQ